MGWVPDCMGHLARVHSLGYYTQGSRVCLDLVQGRYLDRVPKMGHTWVATTGLRKALWGCQGKGKGKPGLVLHPWVQAKALLPLNRQPVGLVCLM